MKFKIHNIYLELPSHQPIFGSFELFLCIFLNLLENLKLTSCVPFTLFYYLIEVLGAN